MMTQSPESAVHPKTRAERRAWLQQNHNRDEGIWFIRYKTSSGKSFFDVNDAIEKAIYFGWIVSLPRKLDEERTMLYFAPR